jgi:hypothetical protein
VTVKDNSNPAISIQTVKLTVGGNIYEVTVPAQQTSGVQNTFSMSITLKDSITGNVVTSANQTVDLYPILPSGSLASGTLGVTSAQIINGVANISSPNPEQSYSLAEDILIRVVERTNNTIKNTGNSPVIHFVPRQVSYVFDLPSEAVVNAPFNITIRAIDVDTGSDVKNLNRTNDLEVYSTLTGAISAGTFVPRGAGVVNIVNGVAAIQGTHNAAETIFFKMRDNTFGNPVTSPAAQLDFTSQSSVNVKPGPLAAINIGDFDMLSKETTSFLLIARDSSNNPIPVQTLVFEVTSIELPGQMLINGNVNGLTQKTNGNGEINVLFAPSANANGVVELVIRDGDRVNGFTKVVHINVNGFPNSPSRAPNPGDELIPLNSTIFLDLPEITLASPAIRRTFYRVDGGAYTLYDPNAGISVFNQLKQYQVVWYSEICYDGNACSNPVSQLSAAGAPNVRAVVTFNRDGKLSGFPSPFNPKKNPYMTLTYELPSNSNVEIDIYDLFGQKVWHKDISAGQEGGLASNGSTTNTVLWPGVNDSGVQVGAGGYIVTVKPGVTGQTMRTKVLVVK